MKKILIPLIFLGVASPVYSKTCVGTISEVSHWSDGQSDRINFTLVNGTDKIKVSTKTKEQVSMVLMAFASGDEVKAYWSCTGTKPPSCNEAESYQICGYISVTK